MPVVVVVVAVVFVVAAVVVDHDDDDDDCSSWKVSPKKHKTNETPCLLVKGIRRNKL